MAGDWANMPFRPEEQPFVRKFGGSDMSFKTTDVATVGRLRAAYLNERLSEEGR